MKLLFQIKTNEALYLRDPESTLLGKNIIQNGILMIDEIGFEAFTFKKLAVEIGTTEASIYRYFENKHRLLIYLVAWYWSWLEYQIIFQTNNINEPIARLKRIIYLLSNEIKDDESTYHINEEILQKIVIHEGAKSYLTKHVTEDNKDHLFKPYKDVCALFADAILACNPNYPYPKSLASTVIEMSHFQYFFLKHLPSLTDFNNTKDSNQIVQYLEHLVFTSLTVKY
jgi:AcrR family transcriptional regulator